MKRTALLAAAITVALAAPTALSATAAAAHRPGHAHRHRHRARPRVPALEQADADEHRAGPGHRPAASSPLSDDGVQLAPGRARHGHGGRVTATPSRSSTSSRRSPRARPALPAWTSTARCTSASCPRPASRWTTTPPRSRSVQQYLTKASDYWSSQTGGHDPLLVRRHHPEVRLRVPAAATPRRCGTRRSTKFADAGHRRDRRREVPAAGRPDRLVGDRRAATTGSAPSAALDADRNATFVSDANQSLYAHELGPQPGPRARQRAAVHRRPGRRLGRQQLRQPLLPLALRGPARRDGLLGGGVRRGEPQRAHLDDLGLDPAAIRAVTGPATVTVPPLSDTTAAGRGLRVTDTNGVTLLRGVPHGHRPGRGR